MTQESDTDEYPDIHPPAYAALEKLWDLQELAGKLRDDVDRFIALGVPQPSALVLKSHLRHLVGEHDDACTLGLSQALFSASKALNEARRAERQSSICAARL